MHTTRPEAEALVRSLRSSCDSETVEVVLCPPFTALAEVARWISGTRIGLGSQNMHWETQGAFTGEVSGPMLKELGCRYVIVGHSERRTLFSETDEDVRRKVEAVLAHQLTPILCIGERLEEREQGKTFDVLTRQLEAVFKNCDGWDCGALIVAYEPVWAIGTGKNATPEQAQEAHQFIRGWIETRCGVDAAQAIRIQYGGSVKAENAASLLGQADVDGALVGGASLKADAFAAIVKAAGKPAQVER